jgi:hypothetical protein
MEIRNIQEKLDTLSSRVDNLENLSSRSNNSVELQNVTTEQSSDAGNIQEQQVYAFLVKYILFKIDLREYIQGVTLK